MPDNKKRGLIYAPKLKIEKINPIFIKNCVIGELENLSKILSRAGFQLNYEIVEKGGIHEIY